MKVIVLVLATLFASVASHAQNTEQRDQQAQKQYMINCQGCHLSDGRGLPGSVPSMKNFVGKFLSVKGGREFLVQVPGSANSPLNDGDLANLLNWILRNMSAEQVPENFTPYTQPEVSKLRADLLVNVDQVRANLVAKF